MTLTENCFFLHCSKQFQKRNLGQWPLQLEHRKIWLMCCCFCIFQSHLRSFCFATLNTLYTCGLTVPPNRWTVLKRKLLQTTRAVVWWNPQFLNLLKLLRGWRIFFGILKNGRNTIFIYVTAEIRAIEWPGCFQR